MGTQSVFDANNGTWRVGTRFASTNRVYFARGNGSGFDEFWYSVDVNDGNWHHIACVRQSGTITLFVDGEDLGTPDFSTVTANSVTGTCTSSEAFWMMRNARPDNYATGKISNARIVKGTAVYTSNFLPPSGPLTNISGTSLLCCQSNSSVTASTVSGGTISNLDAATAGSETVAYSGTNALDLSTSITWPTSITWNGGTAPTLAPTRTNTSAAQVFNLVTSDGGSTWYGYEEVDYGIEGSNNELFGWGDNGDGELAQNDVVLRSSPTQIPGATWSRGCSAGSAGNLGHDLFIKTDGTMWVWGSNSYGELGQNNLTKYSSPVQIPGTTWCRVQGSANITAVKTDGTLWSWGNKSERWANGGGRRSSPIQIPGSWSTEYNSCSGGYYSSFAIRSNGTLWGVGWKQNGMLGQNEAVNVTMSSPIQIPGTTWRSVGVLGQSRLATKTDGTLWGWGTNGGGELGTNDTVKYSSPAQIPGTTWDKVSSGNYTVTATKTDGTLWTWGNNSQGALGLNDVTQRSSPTQVGSGTNWSEPMAQLSFDGGGQIAGGVKTDGTLWVWGQNERGELGQNSISPGNTGYSSPVQIPGTTWTWIGSGTHHAMGLKSV